MDKSKMIWVIGGTKDSRILIERLIQKNLKIIITTATKYGKKLVNNFTDNIVVRKMLLSEMEEFINENNIEKIIDASHPYAENVSKNAIEASNKTNTLYIRFERKILEYRNAQRFADYEELIEYININCKKSKLLSTVGSNNLDKLTEIKSKLIVRILPTTYAVKKAEELGYLPKQIIGIQGPVSTELNKVLLKDYGVDYLITKESGKMGGEMEKVKACDELGVKILVIKRPRIDYPAIFYDIDAVINEVTKDV